MTLVATTCMLDILVATRRLSNDLVSYHQYVRHHGSYRTIDTKARHLHAGRSLSKDLLVQSLKMTLTSITQVLMYCSKLSFDTKFSDFKIQNIVSSGDIIMSPFRESFFITVGLHVWLCLFGTGSCFIQIVAVSYCTC
jgi:hypothetical protein